MAPPTPQDRFLLRDQALELLSYLELLEGKRTAIAGTTYTCGELYGQGAQHPEWTAADKTAANMALYKVNAAALDATDVALRYPAAPAGTTDPGPSRLEFYTGIIRAAGSLSQELVNDAVYADLGGAEQRAAGMSPQERAATLWRPTDEPYNSMAHLARVLYGRQATIGYRSDSPATPAPRPPASCASDVSGWVAPERVWQWAPIPALRNRGLDAPALSGRQLRAARAIRGSRILPDVTTPIANLRTSMRTALVQDMATGSGLTVAQVEATDFGSAISTYVDSFGDAELGAGAMRGRVALGLATNRDATTPVSLLAAGKTGATIGGLAQLAVPAVAPIGDPAAYMAALGTGANCTGTFPGFADDMRAVSGDWVASLDGRPEGGRTQDIFAVGQGLRGVMLRMLAASAGTAASAETKAAQQGTLNELESWAGGQRFVLFPTGTGVEVHAYDVDFAALDVAETPEAIRNSFVLARGSTDEVAVTHARCAAADVGADCAGVTPWVASAAELIVEDAAKETRNIRKSHWKITFAAADDPAGYDGGLPQLQVASYLVAGTASKRTILGGFSNHRGSGMGDFLHPERFGSSFVYSPFRQRLAGRLFGLNPNMETLGGSAADPNDYCIPGVPRNLTVPLENELTSDGDGTESSYKYYLAQARAAAEKADALGRELTEIETQKAERSERGYEEVFQLTGAPMSDGCFPDKDGEVSSECSPLLAGALDSRTVDLVLLAQDPIPNLNGNPARLALQSFLGCEAVAPSGGIAEPKACALMRANKVPVRVSGTTVPNVASGEFSYVALGLVAPQADVLADSTQCAPIAAEAHKATNGEVTALEAALTKKKEGGWLSDPQALQQAFGAVQFTVADNGEFTVSQAGRLIASSTASDLWPGCLDAMYPGCAASNGELNDLLQNTFRACSYTAPLGACESNAPTDGERRLQELNGIRWRMLGATWLGHAMAGRVPKGAFDMPVPAISFASLAGFTPDDVGDSRKETEPCALVSTVYGTAGITPPSFTPRGWAPALSDAEGKALGTPFEVSEPFNVLSADSGQYPSWYRAIYRKNGGSECYSRQYKGKSEYYHLRGANAELVSKFDNVARVVRGTGGVDGEVGTGVTSQGLLGLARVFDKSSCSGSTGYQGLVFAMKSNFTDNSPGSVPFLSREGDGDAHFMAVRAARPGSSGFLNSWVINNNGHTEDALNGDASPLRFYWAGEWTDRWWPCDSGDRDNRGLCLGKRSETRTATPDLRVRFFANSWIPQSGCDAVSQFASASALACTLMLARPPAPAAASVPAVTREEDLPQFEAWTTARETDARRTLQRLHADNVPIGVLAAFQAGTSSASSAKGEIGSKSQDAARALRAMASATEAVLQSPRKAREGIQGLELDLAKLKLAEDQRDDDMEQLILSSAVSGVQDFGKLVAAILPPNPGKLIKGGAEAAVLINKYRYNFAKLNRTGEGIAYDRLLAMHRLGGTLNGVQDDLRAQLANAQSQALSFQQAVDAVGQSQAALQGALGRAKGLGIFSCKDSSGATAVCQSPLNSVLNRRYSATQRRYEVALRDAKALSYIARRSIEQRFGVRLDQVFEDVGPLEAPAKWADLVCQLRGVDTKSLRKELPLTATDAERAAYDEVISRGYADAFVGDYVDRLQHFVDYYGVKYPFRSGDDATVLSAREQIFRNVGECSKTSSNLLASTQALDAVSTTTTSTLRSWQLLRCTADSPCTTASPAGFASSELPNQAGSAVWLHTRDFDVAQDPSQGVPAGRSGWSQAVTLDPGHHALSWWDQHLDRITGNPLNGTAAPYRASIVDDAGIMLATRTYVPNQAVTGTAAWSDRHSLAFDVAQRGVYRLVYEASAGGAPGSVAIANPMLQRDDYALGATAYEGTDSEGLVRATNCASTSEQLRSKFTRRCEVESTGRNVCFYESTAPFSIDTGTFTVNGNPLSNLVAAGNFNYRHGDLAVNLVGVGVRDCSTNPSPSCYASSVVDFDLRHVANAVSVEAFDGERRPFDFGTATISHGKALTAERYITFPLSSADDGLIRQSGILKTELFGRPLDGQYTLRIYDSGNLRWGKLEDIQVILRNRYWSRVSNP